MNDLELLDHLFEEHSCSNCSQGAWCEDGQGVCERWKKYDAISTHKNLVDKIMKARAEIDRDIKRGGVIWTA